MTRDEEKIPGAGHPPVDNGESDAGSATLPAAGSFGGQHSAGVATASNTSAADDQHDGRHDETDAAG